MSSIVVRMDDLTAILLDIKPSAVVVVCIHLLIIHGTDNVVGGLANTDVLCTICTVLVTTHAAHSSMKLSRICTY